MEKTKKIAIIIIVLLILALSGSTYYLYSQSKQLKQEITTLKNNPQIKAQEETKDLIARVARLIVLPEGEEPTVATVSDPEKLKDQPFFAKAKKGDNVLIYTNAKKAILYDPVNNKIVEVAPLNIGNAAAGQETQSEIGNTPAPSISPSPTASPAAKKK